MSEMRNNTGGRPDETVRLPSRPNLRCLGGIVVKEGRQVRAARFVRSTALINLSSEEEAWLVSLDPAMIVDFRDNNETKEKPLILPGLLAARRVALPIEAGAVQRLRGYFFEGNLDHDASVDVMIDMYRSMVRLNAPVFSQFLRHLNDIGERTVLFHCAAGKDRTGVAAALILSALGASREHIMQDYLATGALWHPSPEVEEKLPPISRAAVFGVNPAYLEAAFEEFDRSFGGAEAFARTALGGQKAHRDWVSRHVV